MKRALIIGNSDGIGLALTHKLLDDGWRVSGISRSPAPIDGPGYRHRVVDIRSLEFCAALADAWSELTSSNPGSRSDAHPIDSSADHLSRRVGTAWDTCVYCAGIGDSLDLDDLESERATFEVNLMGAVTAIEVLLPRMLDAGQGHFIGLSSQADELRNPDAPSYSASKAGMSSYLEALGKAVRARGVAVSNIRFGFVATKLAKSDVKPFIISAEQAAERIVLCMRKKPIRYTYPKRMAALLWLMRRFQ